MAVRVPVADLTTRPMDHDIALLIDGDLAGGCLRSRLRIVDRGDPAIPGTADGPGTPMGDDVLVLTHLLLPRIARPVPTISYR